MKNNREININIVVDGQSSFEEIDFIELVPVAENTKPSQFDGLIVMDPPAKPQQMEQQTQEYSKPSRKGKKSLVIDLENSDGLHMKKKRSEDTLVQDPVNDGDWISKAALRMRKKRSEQKTLVQKKGSLRQSFWNKLPSNEVITSVPSQEATETETINSSQRIRGFFGLEDQEREGNSHEEAASELERDFAELEEYLKKIA